MSWVGVGVGVSAIGVGLSGANMLMGGKKGKGLSLPKPPDWYEDPYYKKTQDQLYGYGSDLLAGKPNDYYAPIGEVGGSMFEDLVAQETRDITTAVEESAAKRGMGRSGATSNAVARAVGDKTTQLRWSDFLRAMQGRQGFLQIGKSMVEGVRGAGLTNQGQRNSFNLSAAGFARDNALAEYNAQERKDAQQANAQGDFFGSLIEGGMTLGAMGQYLKGGETAKTTTPTGSLDLGKADYDFGIAGKGKKLAPLYGY